MTFEVLELHPDLLVYRGAFPDPLGFIEKVNAMDGWHQWYLFGNKLDLQSPGWFSEKFPARQEWEPFLSEEPSSDVVKTVEQVFFSVTEDYVTKTGYSQPNWHHFAPSMCKYDFGFSVSEEQDLVMHYHTDYQQERSEEPGFKFGLTCTMYLNDDYEGGEISFKVFKEDGTYSKIEYKPQQGDVMVFPSGEPFFHGVKTVQSNNKYFLRTFWWYNFDGTPEWHANQEKYGEEQWALMEKERWKAGFRAGSYVRND
jgi:hypothetical protein